MKRELSTFPDSTSPPVSNPLHPAKIDLPVSSASLLLLRPVNAFQSLLFYFTNIWSCLTTSFLLKCFLHLFFFFKILTAFMIWPLCFFSALLIPRFLYRFLCFCLFLKYVVFSSFFSLQLVVTFIPMTSVIFILVIPKPLSLARILCRDLNYPKPGWLWNISAWYILKVKVKVTQSCPTHFYLVHLEKPENQRVQKELIFYFSLLLISNQLLSPFFFTLFFEGIPWWSSD